MSSTLKKIGVEITSFSRERQTEALNQINSLRVDPIIFADGENFDWSNLKAKPDLLEMRDHKINQELYEDDEAFEIGAEWPYAENSLFIFSSTNPFRLGLAETVVSPKFKVFMRAVTLLNVIAFCSYDYRTRLQGGDDNRNRILITIEIICNIIFGCEVLLQVIVQGFVFEQNSYLRSWWNIINFSTFIGTWAMLGDINSANQLIHLLRIVRLFRVIRLIQDSRLLKTQMDAFIGSFPRLGPILIPLLFVLIFYTIVGLHLFMGLTEYRCRETPEPEEHEWLAIEEIKNLCGVWECTEGYCGSPADYGLHRNFTENYSEQLYYNLNRFDDFFTSLFVTFTFLNAIGWSATTFLYWHAMTTYATAFYFISLILILAYILSNLLLATFYESFIVFSSIKSNKNIQNKEREAIENEIMKKKQQQMMSRLAQMNEAKSMKKSRKNKFQVNLVYNDEDQDKTQMVENFEKIQQFSSIIAKSSYFLYLNLIIIMLSIGVIAADHYGIEEGTYHKLQAVDFFCIIYFFFELIIMIWGKGVQEYYREFINIFDSFVIVSQFGLIVYLFFAGEPIVYNENRYVNFVKAFKIMRLMSFLYVARIFYTISLLSRCLVQTIIKLRDMILLFLILILVLAVFGQELLAYKAMFQLNEEGEYVPIDDQHKGVSASVNFESFGNSYMAATNIFYNEEWQVTMYNYGHYTYTSIIYYVIGIIFGQVLFVRLLTAVFLNEFCKQLKMIEIDLKPLDLWGNFISFFNYVQASLRQRQRQKVHQSSQIAKSPKAAENRFSKIVRPSMFHDLRQQQIHEQQHQLYPQTPSAEEPKLQSNLLSHKESMVHNPLQKEDQTNYKQDQKLEGSEYQPQEIKEQSIQDKDENQLPEEEEEEEQQKLSSPEFPPQQQGPQPSQPRRGNSRLRPSDKTLFLFAPESDFRMLVTTLVSKNYFRAFNFVLILLTSVRIALLNPTEDPDSELSYVLQVGYIFLTVFYILVILLNCIAFGLYKTEQSWFRQSVYNIFTFMITLVDLITLIFAINNPLSKFITSLRILQFIQIGAVYSKDIGYAQTSLLNAFYKMIQLAIFCFFILAMFGVLATKLLKGEFHFCSNLNEEYKHEVHDNVECMDYGGSWVNSILNFDSIFQSILFLFISATTENWLPLMIQSWSATGVNKQPEVDHNRYWAFFFQIFFFIGNLCMLNMFIGLIVNAYQEAKTKAQNLDLLDETQREWFQIKMSIYSLRPLVKSKKPKNNKFRELLFYLVKDKGFKILWLIIIFLNTLTLSLYYHRQEPKLRTALDYLNSIFVYTQLVEILLRFVAKDLKMYFKDTSNIIDIFAIWLCVANLYVKDDIEIDFYFRRIFNAISVGFQIIRNFRIIKRFNNLEKLFSSILSIIPSALSMMFIMLIFLFIFTTLGIDMFAYLRTQKYIDGYNLHFRTFPAAMFSLVRVASSEYWWALLVDSLHEQEPDFACIYMFTHQDFLNHGFNGCGTSYAYLFYISFHLIFSLMILNLFIASIIGAYEEHVKQEESAISKYQLNDVLTLWRNYDDQGEGFINYKLFWKLSSEIAIIFGVDQADLLDVNNKKNFLKVLNIPIYESKKDQILCYKFHDVILSLTKISVTLKYGVTNLEPTDKIIQQKLQQQIGEQQYYNSKLFTTTSFNSGDMVAIITIQKKFRLWKRRIQIKKEGGDVNQIYNDMSDFKNMIKKQIQLEEEQERQKQSNS